MKIIVYFMTLIQAIRLNRLRTLYSMYDDDFIATTVVRMWTEAINKKRYIKSRYESVPVKTIAIVFCDRRVDFYKIEGEKRKYLSSCYLEDNCDTVKILLDDTVWPKIQQAIGGELARLLTKKNKFRSIMFCPYRLHEVSSKLNLFIDRPKRMFKCLEGICDKSPLKDKLLYVENIFEIFDHQKDAKEKETVFPSSINHLSISNGKKTKFYTLIDANEFDKELIDYIYKDNVDCSFIRDFNLQSSDFSLFYDFMRREIAKSNETFHNTLWEISVPLAGKFKGSLSFYILKGFLMSKEDFKRVLLGHLVDFDLEFLQTIHSLLPPAVNSKPLTFSKAYEEMEEVLDDVMEKSCDTKDEKRIHLHNILLQYLYSQKAIDSKISKLFIMNNPIFSLVFEAIEPTIIKMSNDIIRKFSWYTKVFNKLLLDKKSVKEFRNEIPESDLEILLKGASQECLKVLLLEN